MLISRVLTAVLCKTYVVTHDRIVPIMSSSKQVKLKISFWATRAFFTHFRRDYEQFWGVFEGGGKWWITPPLLAFF